jgi:hypothetical protein
MPSAIVLSYLLMSQRIMETKYREAKPLRTLRFLKTFRQSRIVLGIDAKPALIISTDLDLSQGRSG